jgi:ABC-type lipoprotein export system ATPase subunit
MANIYIKDMSLTYSGKTFEKSIFKNVNLNLGPTGLIGIIGESGSGKSSLLNLLANYQKCEKGRVEIDVSKDRISVIFQSFNLLDHLDVESNVALPLILSGVNKIEAVRRANIKLEEVGIPELAKRKINQISGGQKARVSLARGLILNPKILLADEPTGSLDRENSIKVMELLQDISQNNLIIVVTHNEEIAKMYCSEIYKISNFQLVKVHEVKKLKSKTIDDSLGFYKRRIKLKENLILACSFLKKRTKKVVIASIFCSLCFALLFIDLNVNKNSSELLNQLSYNQVDYTCVNFVEKRTIDVPNQDMSLVKNVRLSKENMNAIKLLDDSVSYYPSLESFIIPYTNVLYKDEYLNSKVFMLPCFPEVSKISGQLPEEFDEVIVNNSFLEMNAELHLGSYVTYEDDLIVETNYLSHITKDVLHQSLNFKIVGISKEQNVINRPSIYYDYLKMYENIADTKLENASEVYSYNIYIEDRLSYLSYEDDTLTCFKTLAKVNDPLALSSQIASEFSDIEISNAGLDLATSINSLISSLSQIIMMFLFLTLTCSFFLELVFINNLYEEKRTELALYLSFHISHKEFMNLGMGQVFILSFIILILSSILFVFLSWVGNLILFQTNLPLFFTMNVAVEDIFALLLLSFIFSYFSSQIPLKNIYSRELIESLRGE